MSVEPETGPLNPPTVKRLHKSSKYTPELAEEILIRMAQGESVNAICQSDHMPSEVSVRRWAIDDVDGFAAKYARAREELLDHIADDICRIADTEKDPQVARVRIDARKWVLSKLRPRQYGDKLEVKTELTFAQEFERMLARASSTEAPS